MGEQEDYAYDVFISYSHADRAWVRGELLSRLEDAGLTVCMDFRDFRPGAPRVDEMERAVVHSHKTLLVLTPAYLEDEWAEFGNSMVQTLDPASRDRRFIPLLKADCERPLRIRHLTYVDLAHPEDWDIAWTQLLTALGAPPVQVAPEPPTRAEWCLKHPYLMPPNFTGRTAERGMLSDWLAGDAGHPLLAMRALGGFGKSALAWHWLLHDVDPARWPRVVWWGFYDDRNFEAFLRETLEYLVQAGATHLQGESNAFARALHLNPRGQAETLLRLLHHSGTLLVLDGFERALRAYGHMDAAYQGDAPSPGPSPRAGEGAGGGWGEGFTDCLSPAAEFFLRGVACLPGLQGKVLLTTRLRPRILEAHGGDLLQGCREVELTQMGPADAVAFFRAQGVRGARAEIERACAPYGYHPLSLRLLAGLIARDPAQPGDIRAARRLDVSGDLKQRRHHVLETAYANLDPKGQKLLSTVACFRGPVGYEALQRTFRVSETLKVLELDAALRELADRGLLGHDRKTGRYDLHPIVRRYAYDHLGGTEREDAHRGLRDYFNAVPPPDRVTSLDDLAPVIELYHHTARAGLYDEAFALMRDRLGDPIYFQFGAYQTYAELLRALFPDGEDRPPRLKDESAQAWTLNELANSYSLSGQPRRAVPLFERNAEYDEKHGRKRHLAVGLGNLACTAQIHIGALRAAEGNLRRSIVLCREIEGEFWEAVGHQELGRLLAYRGAWAEAEEELAAALAMFEEQRHVQAQGVTWAYRAQRALLLARWSALQPPEGSGEPGDRTPSGGYTATALAAARRALELAEGGDPNIGGAVVPRDLVDAHWLLGAAHRVNGDPDAAERHLSEALTRCRSINSVDAEADILLDLARLQVEAPPPVLSVNGGEAPQAQGRREEALRLAEEALLITERSGYVLQGADVHLFLAEMALERGDRGAALELPRRARELATCDGPPDYAYKVAYEEAGALLERLGVKS